MPADLVPEGCTLPVIVGIDPGTRVVGYGAVVLAPEGPRFLACGVIRAGERRTVPRRLARIREELEELLDGLRPTVVVVETAFSAKNVRAALRIGEGRGVALAAAAARGCEVVELAPAAAKKAVLGHGGASKDQVRAMVGTILGVDLSHLALDASDALSLALAHVNRIGLLESIRAARREPG